MQAKHDDEAVFSALGCMKDETQLVPFAGQRP